MRGIAFAAAAALSLLCLLSEAGERYAVIIGAKSGDQALFETVKEHCARTQAALLKGGFPAANVATFAEGGASSIPGASEPSADAILARLAKLSETAKDGDQLWVFLYGDANINQKGLSIASSGKRLRGSQLAEALDKIDASQFVFCMTRQSYGALEPLSSKPRLVATATSEPGQMNPPLLPGFLLDRFESNPGEPLLESLKAAGEKVKEHFVSSGLAVAESPTLFDGAKLLPFPFDGASLDLASLKLAQEPRKELAQTSLSNEPAPAKDAAKKPLADASKEPKIQPPTPETKDLVEKAANAAKRHEGFGHFVLESAVSITIAKDLSQQRKDAVSSYLVEDFAAEELSSASFVDFPPDVELKILKARIIFPDGSFLDAKPETPPYDLKNARRLSFVKFPGAKAGCLIQIETSTAQRQISSMPFMTERVVVGRAVPVDSAKVSVTYPLDMDLRFDGDGGGRAKREPGPSTPYAKTLVFDYGSLLALEQVPGDPPAERCLEQLKISSMADWGDFSKWAVKVVSGNGELDQPTKELVARLTKGLKSDKEKLKALYEFLCELHYETTPVGLRGFRPRTPGEVCSARYGDCKDKANALVAMAKEAGIPGCMALLNRGGVCDSPEKFPCWTFNHALAFFPKVEGFPKGLWCDATDGATPFGTLPPGDTGRYGLLLASEKPEFKEVTPPDGKPNVFDETIELELKGGFVSGKVSIKASGFMDYTLRQEFKRLSPNQRVYAMQRLLDESLGGLEVAHVRTSPPQDLSSDFSIEAEMLGAPWASTGKRVVPPFKLWDLAAIDRRNGLILFDGQPVEIRQKVKVSGEMSFEKEISLKATDAMMGKDLFKLRDAVRDTFIDIK